MSTWPRMQQMGERRSSALPAWRAAFSFSARAALAARSRSSLASSLSRLSSSCTSRSISINIELVELLLVKRGLATFLCVFQKRSDTNV